MANRTLSRLLLIDAVKQNAFATLTGVVVLIAIGVFTLNHGSSSTFEDGTIVRQMVGSDKYQASDTIVFVEVSDGRVVAIDLVNGAIPPVVGTIVKLRRVKRIWFGDYFMLAP